MDRRVTTHWSWLAIVKHLPLQKQIYDQVGMFLLHCYLSGVLDLTPGVTATSLCLCCMCQEAVGGIMMSITTTKLR